MFEPTQLDRETKNPAPQSATISYVLEGSMAFGQGFKPNQ